MATARPVMASRVRAFGITSSQALKESDRDIPDLPNVNEKHKQDQIQKQKEGKGHWKPELASDSEEAISADRAHKEKGGEESIEELQNRTREHAQKKLKHGTSQDTGL